MFILDGYRTLITFSIIGRGTFTYMEKELQPPQQDLGGPIDVTTMRNRQWRTKWRKNLINLDEVTVQVAYDPEDIVTASQVLLGAVTTITISFPDGTLVAFYGWLESFKPASLKEGEFPMAEMKIHIANIGGFAAGSGTPQEFGPTVAPGSKTADGVFPRVADHATI